MTTRKLVLTSGADRVGKSTTLAAIQKYLGEENCDIIHLSEPPNNQNDPYDINREKIGDWVASGKEYCFFDRSYPCSMVYEERRRGNAGHLSHIVELEIELMDCASEFEVVHLCICKPWQWSAKHHLIEVRQLYPEAAPWFIRDQMVNRMREHKEYYEKIGEFYNNITMFPSTYFFDTNKTPRVANLIDDINYTLK